MTWLAGTNFSGIGVTPLTDGGDDQMGERRLFPFLEFIIFMFQKL
jgi:hypothetical protein